MAVKKNNWDTFYSYYKKSKQLFAKGKPILKEMLNYWYEWRTVAHWLAYWSDESPHWQIDDKEILVLRDKYKNTVAHELAYWHPSWATNDPEILYLKDQNNKTVKEILVGKIMAGEKDGN